MRPLAVFGRLIASASTNEHADNPMPDWSEQIDIYRTETGRFVARCARSVVGQAREVEAEVLENADDLVAHLSDGEEVKGVVLRALERAAKEFPEIAAALVVQVP